MKKFVYYLFVFLLPLICLSTKCIGKKDLETSIYIENKMDKAIYIVPNFNYPDTVVDAYFNKKTLQANPKYSYAPLSAEYLGLYGICNEEIWKRFVTSDTILILVLNKDSVDINDWENYALGNNFLRKYKYSYNDIIENNCKIVIE